MQIEVIDIRKIVSNNNVKAYADVKIGGLIIKGFVVMNGKNGVFVSMPRKAGKDGRWFDILKPLDSGLKKDIEDRVLEAYDRETDGVKSR
jgi:stage V sporulation protein G